MHNNDVGKNKINQELYTGQVVWKWKTKQRIHGPYIGQAVKLNKSKSTVWKKDDKCMITQKKVRDSFCFSPADLEL